MTQRERIHQMLRSAGERGIRSDDFFAAHMPRAAARIQELRDSGVEISSEREGKFVRYKLISEGVGVDAGNRARSANREGQDSGWRPRKNQRDLERVGAVQASVHSDTPEGQLFQLPSRSAFTDSEWAA